MNPNETPQDRLAVLIDADNAQPSITEGLLTEIAKYGIASVKRIYGDWTTPSLGGWKSVLLEHSIQPVQQFRYTVGKNATDTAMIIDAMDLLYTKRFDGFCLVSSDSDFTRLASRIREEGLTVYGFGEQKTPKAFVSACDKFIFTEVGYPSLDGGAVNPWDYTQVTAVDLEEQRRAFSAFIKSWNGVEQLGGVFFWDWYGKGGAKDRRYTPRGKPAADEIKRWFGRLARRK